jgi:adenosine deaminase
MSDARAAHQGANGTPVFPLIELHCHLEGAFTASDVVEARLALGRDGGMEEAGDLAGAITLPPGAWPLATWRPLFDRRRQCFDSLDMVEALTRQLVLRYHRNGGRHLELRFNPVYMGLLTSLDPIEIVRRVIAGATPPDERMSTAVIVLATRDRGPVEASEAARVAVRFAGDGVAGFDLAGQERGHPAHQFVDAFDIARSGGLHLTAHAGEEVGAESIRAALETLCVERIGHGLTVTEAPELASWIAGDGVTLEMCPLSNVRTGCIGSVQEHPAGDLLRRGVRVTLNSDDPGFLGHTLSDDYREVVETADLTDEEVRCLVTNAAEAAFLPRSGIDRLKADVRADFDAAAREGLSSIDLLQRAGATPSGPGRELGL